MQAPLAPLYARRKPGLAGVAAGALLRALATSGPGEPSSWRARRAGNTEQMRSPRAPALCRGSLLDSRAS